MVCEMMFDIEIKVKEKPKITCRSCKFRYKHQYGKMFYCRLRFKKGTAYGNMKVKAGDAACELYQKIQRLLNDN